MRCREEDGEGGGVVYNHGEDGYLFTAFVNVHPNSSVSGRPPSVLEEANAFIDEWGAREGAPHDATEAPGCAAVRGVEQKLVAERHCSCIFLQGICKGRCQKVHYT